MSEALPPTNPVSILGPRVLLRKSASPRTLLAVLFLVALCVRCIGFMLRGDFGPPPIVGAEAGVIAQHIVSGLGFTSPFESAVPGSPSIHLPPAYPYFLAGLMKLGLSKWGIYYTAVLVNLFASAMLPVLTLLIGEAAGFPLGVSLLAAMGMCLCPEAFRAVGLVWDEALFVTLSAAMIWWIFRRFRAGPKRRDSAFLGAASGALALLNPALVLALPAAWLMGLRAMRVQWKALAAHALIFTAFTFVGSAPWNVRNWFLLHPPAYVFIRGNFWLEIWSSIHPVSPVTHENGLTDLEPLHPWNNTEKMQQTDALGITHRLTEQEYDAWCRQRALAEFRLHPALFWKHLAVEFNAFWLGIAEAQRWRRSPVLFFLAQGVPAILGLAGLILARRQIAKPIWSALGALLIVFPLPYYLAGGAMRYRHPIDLLLYLGLGWLAWRALERLNVKRASANHDL